MQVIGVILFFIGALMVIHGYYEERYQTLQRKYKTDSEETHEENTYKEDTSRNTENTNEEEDTEPIAFAPYPHQSKAQSALI
jgi:hypothetical protein